MSTTPLTAAVFLLLSCLHIASSFTGPSVPHLLPLNTLLSASPAHSTQAVFRPTPLSMCAQPQDAPQTSRREALRASIASAIALCATHSVWATPVRAPLPRGDPDPRDREKASHPLSSLFFCRKTSVGRLLLLCPIVLQVHPCLMSIPDRCMKKIHISFRSCPVTISFQLPLLPNQQLGMAATFNLDLMLLPSGPGRALFWQ